MKYEKSCGAVIYKKENNEIKYLLIFNKKGDAKGHWGFPKGHTEDGENETDTAKREIFEETNLVCELDTNFRTVSTYIPKKDVIKDAVYFVAECKNDNVVLQKSEVADYAWCDFEKAKEMISFDRDILICADKYIRGLL